ncbi:hypothetical protein yc1106_08059 [Curvularia clavata]|uniref:Uncharacterized protein n=1 Tax=Curvularia clavata TaxID=95742 RepID=A0A9Q9DWA8_CURCL|nr:hypothetical protein yc1106_08059 [Curvularia clavata]
MSSTSFAHHAKTPAAVSMRSSYKAYRSPFGPQYVFPRIYAGFWVCMEMERRGGGVTGGVEEEEGWVVQTAVTETQILYTIPKNYHGITVGTVARFGTLAAGFGGVAGFFALFFFAEVPKVRDDIMKKIPVLDKFFTNEIPPEDNPF